MSRQPEGGTGGRGLGRSGEGASVRDVGCSTHPGRAWRDGDWSAVRVSERMLAMLDLCP
jgi:hypothetical protein